VRLIVGHITAKEHRGRLRVVMTANTGTQVYTDLDADAAVEFFVGATMGAGGLELALMHSRGRGLVGDFDSPSQSNTDHPGSSEIHALAWGVFHGLVPRTAQRISLRGVR
jgi:hypothetical protein